MPSENCIPAMMLNIDNSTREQPLLNSENYQLKFRLDSLQAEIHSLRNNFSSKLQQALTMAIDTIDSPHRHAIQDKKYKQKNHELLQKISAVIGIGMNLQGKELLTINDKLLAASANTPSTTQKSISVSIVRTNWL